MPALAQQTVEQHSLPAPPGKLTAKQCSHTGGVSLDGVSGGTTLQPTALASRHEIPSVKASPSDKDLFEAANAGKFHDRYVIAENMTLHYVESGSGQPVVLLHGNDGTLQDFTLSIFEGLSRKYNTIAFDRPGHGQSTVPKNTFMTPKMQESALHSALHKLGVVRPILVAHSWSGALALSYALQYPDELSGIVLLAGMAYETREANAKAIYHLAQIPVVGTAAGLIFKAAGRHEIEKQLRAAFSPDPAPKAYVDTFLHSFFRISQMKAAARDEITLNSTLRRIGSQYGKINMPVVIVTGDSDQTVPPGQHSYPLHQSIPHSKLIVLANAGHELQFTRPDDVMKAIDLAAQLAGSSTTVSAWANLRN